MGYHGGLTRVEAWGIMRRGDIYIERKREREVLIYLFMNISLDRDTFF